MQQFSNTCKIHNKSLDYAQDNECS